MSFAVEQHARARIVTDATEAEDAERGAVPVDLRYDPDAAPRSVCLSFAGFPGSPNTASHDWVFARDLLERGLRGPAGSGDVRVWPSGRVRAVVELHSADGVALVQFDSAALTRFLRRTYAAATAPAATAASAPAAPPTAEAPTAPAPTTPSATASETTSAATSAKPPSL